MNRLTDYGIVLLTALAVEPEGGLSARELAARTNLPVPTVVKILKALGRAGLLVSQRGTKGGYALSRPAGEISIAEVIEALEGPLALTECGLPSSCEHARLCPTRSNWQLVNGVVRHALARLTLAEMTHPLEASPAEPVFATPISARLSMPSRSVHP